MAQNTSKAMEFTTGYASAGRIGRYLSPLDPPSSAQQVNYTDSDWMKLALDVAMTAAGVASPNPPVGCVIVKRNQLLAVGATSAYGGLHAEANALAHLKEGTDARGATAYLTLEPCSHTGKQGPCADLLVAAGISRCVVACIDPNPLVSGRGIERLRVAGIKVELGLLKTECEMFMQPFFHFIQNNGPYIALKWAQTSDRCLARDDGTSKWISNQTSRQYTHWLRHYYDVIAVGPGTVLRDFPLLTVRGIHATWIKRQPLRLILDPRGTIAAADIATVERLSQTTFNRDALTLYVGPVALPQQLTEQSHCTQLKVPVFDFSELLVHPELHLNLSTLLQRPLQSIMVEGGHALLTQMLQSNTFHRVHCFTAAHSFGGEQTRFQIPNIIDLPGLIRLPNDMTAEQGQAPDVLFELSKI